MAKVTLWRNPFRWAESEKFEIASGVRFIDWLTEHFPHGFGGNIKATRNMLDFAPDDWDSVCGEDDHFSVFVVQGDPITAQFIYPFYRWVKNQIPGSGVSLNIQDSGSTSYSLNKNQNTAALGGPIPLCYGSPIVTPN